MRLCRSSDARLSRSTGSHFRAMTTFTALTTVSISPWALDGRRSTTMCATRTTACSAGVYSTSFHRRQCSPQ